MKTKSIILSVIILLLLLLWIPVTVEKFMDLDGFHKILLGQSFPTSWADLLFWLLPLLEGSCGLFIVGGTSVKPEHHKLKHSLLNWGFALSTLLLLAFTLFVLFGVLGWYAKRPCGCGSVISGMSWEEHLWFNVAFLLLSAFGWWLIRGRCDFEQGWNLGFDATSYVNVSNEGLGLNKGIHQFITKFWFPRRFAPFPGRPVG